ncbi:TPA: hypothetical protein N0F65_005396 [Lagenidium giganteum]|uniref:Uncharacterized protein n=1 Tax=Lagenidium giganteum TaxID=4803 RepID=A0AAV2Z459_9STRA|nr:TPA: hypothetical protein N0F65_005396 [Lagenidium giganteum]
MDAAGNMVASPSASCSAALSVPSLEDGAGVMVGAPAGLMGAAHDALLMGAAERVGGMMRECVGCTQQSNQRHQTSEKVQRVDWRFLRKGIHAADNLIRNKIVNNGHPWSSLVSVRERVCRLPIRNASVYRTCGFCNCRASERIYYDLHSSLSHGSRFRALLPNLRSTEQATLQAFKLSSRLEESPTGSGPPAVKTPSGKMAKFETRGRAKNKVS